MALNIRSSETDALAAELARLTGETKTEAVTKAVRDRLERVKRERLRRSLADEIDAIGVQSASPNAALAKAPRGYITCARDESSNTNQPVRRCSTFASGDWIRCAGGRTRLFRRHI